MNWPILLSKVAQAIRRHLDFHTCFVCQVANTEILDSPEALQGDQEQIFWDERNVVCSMSNGDLSRGTENIERQQQDQGQDGPKHMRQCLPDISEDPIAMLTREEREHARIQRQTLLHTRSFTARYDFWKLNSKAEGSVLEDYRRRLFYIDGAGDVKYVSEKTGGVDSSVCNTADITSITEMSPKSGSYFTHGFVLTFKKVGVVNLAHA